MFFYGRLSFTSSFIFPCLGRRWGCFVYYRVPLIMVHIFDLLMCTNYVICEVVFLEHLE